MKVTTFGKTAAFGLGAAVLALGALSVPAQADPPPAGALAGAGSDTTQDVLQGLSEASGGLIESWHASLGGTTHDTITVKGFDVTRPNGSSEGRDAFRRSRGTNVATTWATNPVGLGDDVFDFARSSSGPGSNADPNGQLAYVPFGLDALAMATGPTSTLPSFSLAQLQTMYSTGASVTVGGTTYTPDGNITLLIPQAGSGTRSFFAGVMGINATTPPAWVHDTLGGVSVQEHDGTVLENNPAAIAPFSIAQYIAQDGGVSPDRLHGAQLESLGGQAPTVVDPETGRDALNPAWQTELTREVYNIVDYAEVTGGDPLIELAFNGPSSVVCTAETEFPAGSGSFFPTITLYGFGSLGADCGEVRSDLRAFPNG